MDQTPEFAVVDVETTGLFPNRHDRVIEIAILRVNHVGETLGEYSTLVNPERDIGRTDIHGIKSKHLRHAPGFEDVAGDILSLLAGAVFTAHNVHFDRRFVESEFSRIDYALPSFPCLCTMTLGARADRSIPSRRLSAICRHFGIDVKGAHSALGDARATVELLRKCIETIGGAKTPSLTQLGVKGNLLPTIAWPSIPANGFSYRREQAADAAHDEIPYIAHLVAKLPTSTCLSTETEEYLGLLDKVLEDRRVTADEAESLLELGGELGMSREQAICAHESYLRDLARAAWVDGVVTDSERRDLEEVRDLLSVKSATFERILKEEEKERARGSTGIGPCPSNREKIAGKTICFTGEFTCSIDGQRAQRSQAQQLAAEHGMIVVKGVTKKLDFLVVADPDSMSGKARKARDYGIRILAEPVFWGMVGVDVA